MMQQQVNIRTEQQSVEYQEEYRQSFEKSTRKSQKKRKRSKKSKKKKRASSDEDSYTQSESSDSSSSPDEEQIAIDQDIKLVKRFVKTLRKRVTANQNIREWYDTFDKDKSDRIEKNEFINMLARLQIQFDGGDQERMQVMIFKLFDRNNDNFFRFADFEDIIFERIKPNYRKIVAYERQQWLLRQERETSNFAAMEGATAGGMKGQMGGAAIAKASGGAMMTGATGGAMTAAGAGLMSSSSQVVSGQAQQQQTVYQSLDTRIEKSAQNQFQTFEKYGISTVQQISSSKGQQKMPQGTVLQRQQRTMKFEAADQHQSAAEMAARAVELADQAEYESFDTKIENSAQNQFKTFEKYGISTKPKSNDRK